MQQQTTNPSSDLQFKRIGDYLYSPEWKLGSGNFATVYKAIHTTTKQIYALKVIKFESLTTKLSMVLLEQEIGILQELDHPFIIKCHQVINSSNNCYIVMDFCKFGDLQTLLKIKRRFGEDQVTGYVYQLYQGFLYLSKSNILHRDFKPANIFLDNSGACRISDFGFAIKCTQQPLKDVSLGSPFYMAPQIIYKREYSSKTDVWAFGVTLYELTHGNPPLYGVRTPEELKQKVLQPINYGKISRELHIFLQKCLTINPKDRISFEEMQNDPYIQKIIQQYKQKDEEFQSFSETKSCTKSSNILLKTALKKPISYDEAASLLQYCRFLEKVCEIVRPESPILQKWLLIMIKRLDGAKLRENQMGNYQQFRQIIKSYNQKYRKQFKNLQKKIKAEDVIEQCKRILESNKKSKNFLIMLANQTHRLNQSFTHPLKLTYYAHYSGITDFFNQMSASRFK